MSEPEQPAGWHLVEREGVSQLRRAFAFGDFAEALQFTNQVGQLAERENHHPSLVTEWGRVLVSWWSHDAGGVTRRDRRLATLTGRLFEERFEGRLQETGKAGDAD